MKQERLSELFALYMQQASSESEESEFMLLLTDPELRTERDRLLEEWMDRVPEGEKMPQVMADRVLGNILESEKEQTREQKIFPVRRIWWAAAAVLIICVGIYLFTGRQKNSIAPEQMAQTSKEFPPGSFKASLTLGNGSVLLLDSAHEGLIATQGNVTVQKINKGEIAYNVLNGTPAVEYNTLSTPPGGQYKLVLSDGSKIWLNAASSVYFPTAFTGKERMITIAGESYIEVAHHTNQPFIVSIPSTINRQPSTVTVLGTHFNINSYADENGQKVTLLEGLVHVQIDGSEANLTPGQQADIRQDYKIILQRRVDTSSIVAWKNGEFNFQEADIQSIMRQISRWYDVSVVYEGNISKEKFTGVISRNSMLKDVLKILETAGVKFKIEGKKLIVTS